MTDDARLTDEELDRIEKSYQDGSSVTRELHSLLREVRRLREDLQHCQQHVVRLGDGGFYGRAAARLTKRLHETEQRLAAAERDRERLDFLERTNCATYFGPSLMWSAFDRDNEPIEDAQNTTLRDAIDAARTAPDADGGDDGNEA